jgi:hypothetical protein
MKSFLTHPSHEDKFTLAGGVFLFVVAALIPQSLYLAEAQQPKKIPRIGYLTGGDAVSNSTRSEAMRRALHEHGYIEGQIILDFRLPIFD